MFEIRVRPAILVVGITVYLLLTQLPAFAQAAAAPTNTYAIPIGQSISLDLAKKAASGALAEARKSNWFMAAAVVDPAGTLVYYEKMDNTQIGSANVAINKARSAALYKRPTKAFQD